MRFLRTGNPLPKKCEVIGCNKTLRRNKNPKYCYRHSVQAAKGLDFYSKNTNKGEKNGNWKGGVSFYKNHYTMKQHRLTKLQQTNWHCELCGNPAKRVHHKDKTKDNHAIDNLLVVCLRCHRKLHIDQLGRPRHHAKTYEEMGKELGVSVTTVYNYLNNKIPLLRKQDRIIHYLKNERAI